MTVADLEAKAKLQNAHNVLTLDIERTPGVARLQHRSLSVEGDFWDLNSWKHIIGRRIHPDEVTEWPRTICAAWNWYGKDRVEFAAEWGKGGRETMLRRTWEALDKAQIIVGHNVSGFDVKKLRFEWAEAGLTPPSPTKHYDTLKVARREFGAESNTLDSLCKRFGIVAKTDRYSVAMARAAVNGDRAAQKQIKAYNAGDIAATVGFYDFVRPWDASHPHSIIPAEPGQLTCNSCWGSNLEPNGFKLANLILYPLYRCQDCKANVQAATHYKRAAITRGAR